MSDSVGAHLVPPVPSVGIVGVGSAFPSRRIEAAERWPRATGTRYWCATDESTADLAEIAALNALDEAGATPDSIDVLVVATDTPEFIVPSTAVVLQARLGLSRVMALDVAAAGDGFLPALEVARGALTAMAMGRRALVVGVSCLSKYLDVHDERTAPLFGDGAGALVLETGAGPGIVAAEVRTRAADAPVFGIFAGGTRTPITHAILDAGIQNRLRWSGTGLEPAIEEIAQRIRSTLDQAGVAIGEVDAWIWAQPDVTVVTRIMNDLAVDPDRVQTSIHDYGFTGPACIPTTLHDVLRRMSLPAGALMVLAGAGVGRDVCVTVIRGASRYP